MREVKMQVKPQSIILKVRFNTILFPVSFVEMANALEKKGYEISPDLPFPRPAGRLVGTGAIARKGKTVVGIDSSAQTIFIQDVSIKSAIESFDEVLTSLQEECGVDLNELATFYSLNATYIMPFIEEKAYISFAKHLQLPILEKVSSIFQEEVWPYELRFAGAGLKANSKNWFDVSIRPNYERDDSFVVNVVYRNAERDKTRAFINHFEERIGKIFQLLTE